MARKKHHFQWTAEDGEAAPLGERRDRVEARFEREALLSLARRLEALPAGERARLPLDPAALEAIELMAKLGPQSAHRRSMLRVIKLLRSADLEAIEGALAGTATDAPLTRAAERWRRALIEGDDAVLADYLEAHPGVDRQHLRALIRQARKEGKEGKAAKSAARKLFRLIKDALPVGEE